MMNANTGTCLVPDFEVTVPCRSPENKMLSTCVLTNVHNHRGFRDPQEDKQPFGSGIGACIREKETNERETLAQTSFNLMTGD